MLSYILKIVDLSILDILTTISAKNKTIVQNWCKLLKFIFNITMFDMFVRMGSGLCWNASVLYDWITFSPAHRDSETLNGFFVNGSSFLAVCERSVNPSCPFVLELYILHDYKGQQH